MQQNVGIQLLLKILQERKMQVNGAVERVLGLADGMTEREDERPPPGAPVTVSCRATFLVFLIHQRVDVGLLWCFPDGTPGCEPLPSSRLERSCRPLCPAGSRGPQAHAGRGCGVSLRHGSAAAVARRSRTGTTGQDSQRPTALSGLGTDGYVCETRPALQSTPDGSWERFCRYSSTAVLRRYCRGGSKHWGEDRRLTRLAQTACSTGKRR